jgi:3'-5' exoribonuclease
MLDVKANDIIENQPVIVRQITKKNSQNNKEYYHLQISYGIKNYDAKIWSNSDEISQEITPGCIAYIWGNVREFKGNIQIHINKIERILDPDERIVNQVTPSSELSELKLSHELIKLISTINNPNLNNLVTSIFNSDSIKNTFFTAAAGVEIHHAYIGGLAEHTLEVAKTVMHYCNLFKDINYDIALSAALLHDIGKTVELSCFPENKFTDLGRLLGHISIGVQIINEAIDKIPDFPSELKMAIDHCILSHHGTLEMGSPVLPMTLEAVVLHNADQASAEINGFNLAIQRDTRTGPWTDYNSTYKRFIKKY